MQGDWLITATTVFSAQLNLPDEGGRRRQTEPAGN